jgi:putative oxidoreductase
MRTTENATLLLARILMAVIFVLGGWGKLIAPAMTQAYFARYGLPLPPVAWVIAVVVELGGGLAILFGLFMRPAAAVLAIWCVATALVAHTHFADRNMQIHFMKNIAMAGGFLYAAVLGAGAWSLDAAWRQRRRRIAVAE